MEVSETRLATALASVFLLGILLSILNGMYVEDTGSQMPPLTYGIIAVAMAVGAMIILLFQWRISKMQMDRFIRVLPPDEREILAILLKEKRMDQTYLVAESGLSRVKVSRILMRLEQRGIIEKKQMGNTNLIRLLV